MTDSLPKRRVVLLGATGSIGESTLRVIAAHSAQLELVGIAAQHNHARLAEIAHQFGVRHVALHDDTAYAAARTNAAFPTGTHFYRGADGLSELATLSDADIVLVAVVGTAALQPALVALAAKKDLALASKELLVLAGKFVMAAAKKRGAKLLPVDSEHNAVFQCLEHHRSAGGESNRTTDIRRVVLTASGGAFRDWPLERLAQATPADALKHPNWAMGPKVTVDSATLANKGLELIEAQWLFGLRAEQCDAVLHPQSIVHCLVEFSDGSMLTQLCPPSMTFPIQHALLYPARAPQPTTAALDLGHPLSLDFRPVDEGRFPCLRLAKQAMRAGGTAPAVFNAANEIAVAAFLAGRVPFLAIPQIIEHTLAAINNIEPDSLEAVLAVDSAARHVAARVVEKLLP